MTSASTSEVAELLHALYAEWITAGRQKACSMRVVEAAVVIGKTQRDVSIPLTSELAIRSNRQGSDTQAVRTVAGSKWNCLPLRAGLPAGYCMGGQPAGEGHVLCQSLIAQWAELL